MPEKSQEELQLISKAFEASKQGWWVYWPHRCKVKLSEEAQYLLGYNSDKQSETWLSLVHPEDWDDLKMGVEVLNDDETSHIEQEFRIQTKTLGYRWYAIKGNVLEGEAPEQRRVVGTISDVSHKKDTEAALEKLRFEHGKMLETSGEGIFRVNAMGKVVYLNQSARALLRVSAGNTELSLHDILGEVQPSFEKVSTKRQGLFKTFQTGQHTRMTYEVFHRQDGTSFPVEYVSNPMPTLSGDAHDVIISFRDITDKERSKDAERQLLKHVNARMLESRCLYNITQLTLDASKPLKEVLSEMTRLLPSSRSNANHCFARITFRREVYESPNFKETGIYQDTGIKVKGRTIGNVALYFANPSLQEEWDTASTHNTIKLLDTVANLIGTFYKRKVAEEARKESNRKFATLLSNLPGMVFRLEQEQYRFVSQGSMRLTGYLPEDFLKAGNHVNRKSLIHPEDYPQVKAVSEDAIEHEQSYQITYRIFTADKQLRWVWEQGVGVGNAESGVVQIEGFVLDVTEQKKAEASLIESYKERQNLVITQNARLEKKVKNRTKALEESNKQLHAAYEQLKAAQSKLVASEKMASLGQLTAGIAHEINNPVNFIGISSDALQEILQDILNVLDEYEKLTPDNFHAQLEHIQALKQTLMLEQWDKDIRELMHNIDNGVSRTAEIVKELRTFSRIDEAAKKQANIQEGIQSILVILRSQYKTEVEIMVDDGQLPLVECYPGKLNQVIMNVLQNAIQSVIEKKVHQEGKGFLPSVWIDTYLETQKEEHDGILQEQQLVCIKIADNGLGVPLTLKNKVFDPFFTTKDVGKGVGLGLSISMSIMEQHKGSIQLADRPGGGAVFLITLPL